MRLVHRAGTGALELNWSWLPTWIGLNSRLIKEIENAVADSLKGRPLTEELLDEASQRVIDFLAKKHSDIEGLAEYLDGLKFVRVT